MKTSVTKSFAALVALLTCATFAQSQNRERFGISAKAGGVNAVSGKVSVTRDGKSPRSLTSQDDLESGDVVSTSVGGQIEVLLNPGTYLRLAERSEFVMEDTSLDNLLVRLTKGSAIIEATGPDDLNLYIPVVTEQKRITIIRPGVYRFNASPGKTELFVRKGRVALGTTKDDVVKGGKKLTLTGGAPEIAKLTDADKDDFDDWSKTRGQTLARANTRLSARTFNGYLSSGSFGFSNGFSRWGLWTWSPFSSCYTFMPFYYGWGSPYGGSYGAFYPTHTYSNNSPYYGNSTVTTNSSSGGSNSGYGGGSSGGSTGVGSSSGGFGGTSSGRGMGAPSSGGVSPQAGPRDPDSGGRAINAIKPPNN
ncbi:MAG TPA: FecR family protein [Pyrinomonadaceae bacterium]|nr:FecR family protein [Pyrinomonadaceae bacterium]